MKVDIIIPVYNAYEYLIQCVDSIYQYTNIADFTLVLINDCSPDKRIMQYLENLSGKYPNLRISHNEKNLGFVGTVNRGMKQSDLDVILLNSDTEVTPNWLDKMKEAAYSRSEVATVTTLTNSGTICSVPNFCEDNEIPSNYGSYLDFARMIDQCAIAKYPEAPTGVGFCMYIKRSVLNEVGYFDESHFGKGYGEENDFCCRCREHGYKNIIDDCTFVFHKGSMSFAESKNDYIKANLKVLNQLYPYYNRDVALFCEDNPLKEIHDNIKLKIKLENNKKNLLFVLHNDFLIGRNHPCGGTEMHVKDLVDHLKESFNCFVISSHKKNIILDIITREHNDTLCIPLEKEIALTDFYREDYKKNITAICKFFDIGMIHVHHFKGHTFDLVDIAKELHISIIYTIHDFYTVCPNINLLYDDKIYCKFIRSENNCNSCIKHKLQYNAIAKVWKDKFFNNLKQMDLIITPSESAKQELLYHYGSFGYCTKELEIKVIEHGEFEEKDRPAYKKERNDNFTTLVFGGVIKHKGSKMILKLLEECKHVEWYIYGNIYDEDILAIKEDHVHLMGCYKKEEIIEIIQHVNPDITLNLPIWPETFSYVLSESYIACVPVLGTNLGALRDRIIEGKTGWHVSFPLDIGEIKSKIEWLKENPDVILACKHYLQHIHIKYLSDMIAEYKIIYDQLSITTSFITTKDENKMVINGYRAHEKEDSERVSQEEYKRLVGVERAYEQIKSHQEEYEKLLKHVEEVNNSSTWHMLLFINKRFSGIKKAISKLLQLIKRIIKR